MKGITVASLIVSSAVVLAACAPGAGSASKSVSIASLGNFSNGAASTATGTGTLAPDGAKTKVTVSLAGLEPNSAHAGHIHSGSCAAQGPVVVGLTSITADAGGKGTSSTDVDASKLTGSLYFAYHQRDAGDAQGIGGVIACGDIK